MSDEYPTVNLYAIYICEDCIDGKGQECHTPGCALWLHAVDMAIDRDVITRIEPVWVSDGDTERIEAYRAYQQERKE